MLPSRQQRCFIQLLLACLYCIFASRAAFAQGAVAITTAKSALGVSITSHIASIARANDVYAMQSLNGLLFGNPLSINRKDRQKDYLLLATEQESSARGDFPQSSLLHIYDLSAGKLIENPAWRAEPGRRIWPLAVVEQAEREFVVISETGKDVARLLLLAWSEGNEAEFTYARDYRLPSMPVAAIGAGQRLFLMLAGDASTTLHVLDTTAEQTELKRIPLLPAPPGASHVLMLAPGGQNIYAAVSEYEQDGSETTHIYSVSVATETITGVGSVSGAVTHSSVSAFEGGCWTYGRVSGSTFGTLAKFKLAESGLEKELEFSVNHPGTTLLCAAAPRGDRVVVNVDRHLELWDKEGRKAATEEGEAAVGAIAWQDGLVLTGQAGQSFWLRDDTLEVAAQATLQRGHVGYLLPRDDVPTPETFLISPPAHVMPKRIDFRGSAVGRELRSLRLDPGSDAPWRVQFDPVAMPWLRLQPRAGRGAGVSYLGVDPQLFPLRSGANGFLEVQFEAADGVSIQRVPVNVAAAPPPLTRMLWVWEPPFGAPLRDATDPRGYKRLADALAGPPWYVAHDEAAAPVEAALSAYDVVVLHARAAALGALTRQEIVQFVAGGGALLLVGEALDPEEQAAMGSWLSAFGILVTQGEECSVGCTRNSALDELWKRIGAGGAQAFRNADVINGECCGLLARSYGYGRVVLFSGAEALVGESELAREFQAFLFDWVLQPADVSDLDGDGLADETEDADASQGTEPGETDFLNPDSDSDEILDGLEDFNRNGVVDDGETDPRNFDTDADGTWDAADATPGFPKDAVYVRRVMPYSAPAEGGVEVTVTGRNFSRASRIWFGGVPAEGWHVRGTHELGAIVPNWSAGALGPVDVRVTGESGELEGLLRGGFVYTERSQVELALGEELQTLAAGGAYQGIIAVRAEAPPTARVTRIGFVLRTSSSAVQLFPAQPLPSSPRGEAGLTSEVLQDSTLRVRYEFASPGERGTIALVPWQASEEEAPEEVYLSFDSAEAQGSDGRKLSTSTGSYSLRVLPE